MTEISDEMLADAGWERDCDECNILRRKHDLDGFIWSEELHLIELIRSTYMQKVLNKAEGKTLGRMLQRHASVIGQIAADSAPPQSRGILTGLVKGQTAFLAKETAEIIGKALSEDSISPERLFLIRSKITIALVSVIERNSLQEAWAHLYLMQSLGSQATREQ